MLTQIRFKPLLVTTAVAVTVLGGVATGIAAGAAPRAAGSGSADWPMFRENPAHVGVSAETAISSTTAGTLAAGWTASLGTTSYTSPAVATSAPLGQALVYAAGTSTLHAYRASTGAAVWSFGTGQGGGAIDTSPAVSGGVVYVGSTVGTVYALNASTGALLCDYHTGSLIQASPVVENAPDGSGPVVYLGTDPPSGAGAEYAIYGPGNKHGACTKRWKFTSWRTADGGTWSPPAYGSDAKGRPLLVFGSADPDDSVYALNASTGAVVWRHQAATGLNADVGAAPTISYPGRNGVASGVVYATDKDKVVHALNLTTGKTIWRYDLTTTSNASLSSTALAGNVIYLGSNDGVYAINATTGRKVWHVLQGPTFYASPAITGPAGQQVLVIADNAGRVYALSLATGATIWTKRPMTAGYWASPAISQGTIYLAGLDGVLRSYKPAGS